MGFLEMIAAGFAGVLGHVKSRQFVHKKLRFTNWVRRPIFLGLVGGAAAAVAALPVVFVLPFVGKTSAVLFGMAVGAGVSLGARDAKKIPSKTSDWN